MSSLVTQMIVVEKFGLRLDTDKLAQILGQTRAGILNQISAGSFPIKTYKESGKRWADYRDVAEYLDNCRTLAH